jgi:hypothetical protein
VSYGAERRAESGRKISRLPNQIGTCKSNSHRRVRGDRYRRG